MSVTAHSWERGTHVSVWLKPTERCQLRCKHCFVNRDFLAGSVRWDLATFERVLDRLVEYFRDHPVPGRTMTLIWHGGEPLLMGKSFYRAAIPLARERLHEAGVSVRLALQTNLLVVDPEWIDFFREHFAGCVGTSFDWELRRLGDSWERFRERWLTRYWQCREAGIRLTVLTVVNRACLPIPDEVYDFFSGLGCPWESQPMGPFGEGNGRANIGAFGVTPYQYGTWLLRIWTRYVQDPDRRATPMLLDRMARGVAFGEPIGNRMAGDCAAGNLVVSPDGTVTYCPDLAGSREHVYGNLFDTPLDPLLRSPTRLAVFRRQLLLPEPCRRCPWSHLGRGGCPADAFGFAGDALRQDPFCEAYCGMVFPRIAEDLARGRVTLRHSPALAEVPD